MSLILHFYFRPFIYIFHEFCSSDGMRGLAKGNVQFLNSFIWKEMFVRDRERDQW
jgi:hypothetical protein